jgi:hypothetical protein
LYCEKELMSCVKSGYLSSVGVGALFLAWSEEVTAFAGVAAGGALADGVGAPWVTTGGVGADGAVIAFVGERWTTGLVENVGSGRLFCTENISLRGYRGQRGPRKQGGFNKPHGSPSGHAFAMSEESCLVVFRVS